MPTTTRQETIMTGNDPNRARQTAARARENRRFVRHLLNERQSRFAAALESAVQDLRADRARHGDRR
jgi:hypothetical protein